MIRQINRPAKLKCHQLKCRQLREKSFGAVAAEVAVCLPVLFLLLFGCLELARANMLLHATESAAYEGARVGIIPGAQQASVEEAVDFILTTVGASNFSVEILPEVITSTTEEIEVIVNVPYAENAFVPPFFMSDPTFRASCKLRREVL